MSGGSVVVVNSVSPRSRRRVNRGIVLLLGLLTLLLTAVRPATATTSPTPASPTSAPSTSSSAAGSTTLTNFTAAGQQVARFDTDGNALDAHDGQIAQFGDTYYLYGTSYNCGYQYTIDSNFCGFKVYSSQDLTHWTDRGYVALPRSCAYCFRPHVLYDSQTHKYVLWVNDGSVAQGYRVFTNSSPTGVFTEQNLPHLAVSCGIDFTLFQDTDGTSYIVHNDACDGVDLVVEQLTGDYLSTDGKYTRLHLSDVEAPAMFVRDGTYYITMSDPTCAYCTRTGTGYLTADSPLGQWHGAPGTPQAWTVADGRLDVTGGGIGVSGTGADWTDYTFAADVTAAQTGSTGGVDYAQAGMVFRADDSGDGYAFLLSNYPYGAAATGGYVAFVKLSGGSASLVSSTALPFAVVSGQSYHVAVGVSGDTFTATVNGTLADTVTDASFAAGKVGFLENDSDHESATFDNVSVTAPDDTSLFADDFDSTTLSGWNPPVVNKAIDVSPDSCGGQPSFVAPLRGQHGQTVYLYGSDLWDAHRNEGEADFFWAPLRFDPTGAIEPIRCSPTATVALADVHHGQQVAVPGQDQSSGVDGFSLSCTVDSANQVSQTFTAGRSGTLGQVRLTAYQETTPAERSGALPPDEGAEPNAPLTLRLVTLDAHGDVDKTLASQSYGTNSVGFAPENLTLTTDVALTAGRTYAVVASSTTTTGCFGVAADDANPYRSGHAAVSTDGGGTFTAQPARDLKFLTVMGSTGHGTRSAL
jgi:hypothetical protein